MTSIQPIETQYKGYRFRSRLEARWAVFFDALDIEWQYEREGYKLGPREFNPAGGWTRSEFDAFQRSVGDTSYYLPDFYLPRRDMYFEVKPIEPWDKDREPFEVYIDRQWKKYEPTWRLAAATKKVAMVSNGAPWEPEEIAPHKPVIAFLPSLMLPETGFLLWCKRCEDLSLDIFHGKRDKQRLFPCGHSFDNTAYLLVEAQNAAKQVRFEHGKNGVNRRPW